MDDPDLHVLMLDDALEVRQYLTEACAALNAELSLVVREYAKTAVRLNTLAAYRSMMCTLGKHEGEDLVILDLHYDVLPNPANRELAYQLCRDYSVPPDIPERQIDGYILGCILIENPKFRGTIQVGTAQGLAGTITDTLQERIERKQRGLEIQVIQASHALTEACNGKFLTKKPEKDPVRFGVYEHMDFLGGNVYATFICKAQRLGHDDCEEPDRADPAFASLLGMKPEDFRTSLVDPVVRARGNRLTFATALKGMGPDLRTNKEAKEQCRRFTGLAAWLLALGAYRKMNPKTDWTTVFNVDHITQPDLDNYFLLPDCGTRSARTATMRKFFDLCLKLFKPGEDQDRPARPSGPLTQVTFNSTGLVFHLDFPYMLAVGGKPASLEQRLLECRAGVGERLGTSGAIFAFEQAANEAFHGVNPQNTSSSRSNGWVMEVASADKPGQPEGTVVRFAKPG